MNNSPPYFRLSFFYFAYFAVLGVFVPYWTVYLHTAKDFSPVQIGKLMAVFMATKIVAPFLWGWLADHGGQRLRIIRLASVLTMTLGTPKGKARMAAVPIVVPADPPKPSTPSILPCSCNR